MTIDKIFELIIAGAFSWIMAIEIRFKLAQEKIEKLEEKKNHDELKSSVHNISNADLNSLLSKQLGPADPAVRLSKSKSEGSD